MSGWLEVARLRARGGMNTHILSGTTRGGDENATDEHIISDELQAGILKMADRDGATARRRGTCSAVRVMRGAHIICGVDVCSYREEPLDAIDVAVCRCSQQLPTVGVQQLRPFGHRAGVRRVAARAHCTGQALAAPRSDGVRGLLPTQLLPPHGGFKLRTSERTAVLSLETFRFFFLKVKGNMFTH